MENFEGLRNIDNFCTVTLKKGGGRIENERNSGVACQESGKTPRDFMVSETEEPLVDVFDEGDYLRILVQCRCREQEVTFHPSSDGITICKEECQKEKGSPEKCYNVCIKLNLPTEALQLENRLFIIAKCNNNNTLEAMIPKMRDEHNNLFPVKQ